MVFSFHIFVPADAKIQTVWITEIRNLIIPGDPVGEGGGGFTWLVEKTMLPTVTNNAAAG